VREGELILLQCIKCRSDNIKDEDGICPYVIADDQYPLRCVGFWTKEKLYYLQRYMQIFNESMKERWQNRAYIELFAGPGLGIIRDTGELLDGSPILAIEQKVPFTKYIFVEINKNSIDALNYRFRLANPSINTILVNQDCNLSVNEIRNQLGSSRLTLTFIDPTSMQINFETLDKLTKDLRMDLIINFPLQTINRSYLYALNGYVEKYDNFFGTRDWEVIIRKYTDLRSVGAKLLELYKNQLRTIGYGETKDLSSDQSFESGDILVRGPKNIPLYYLVFASKNRLAYKLWNEIHKIRANQQRSLL
jgi:three-Cys-motif partner protein